MVRMKVAKLIIGSILIGQLLAGLFWWFFDWNVFISNLLGSIFLIFMDLRRRRNDKDLDKCNQQ